MNIENISLGIWIPRASIHLKEIFRFLSSKKVSIAGLDDNKLNALREGLGIKKLDFLQEEMVDLVKVECEKVSITMYEEGIIVLSLIHNYPIGFSREDLVFLENFYIEKFSPAIQYLFSRGAPLPKELSDVKQAHPTILTVKNHSQPELDQFIQKENISIYSRSKSKKIDFYHGEQISIINLKTDKVKIDMFLQDVVFLKEFSSQLKKYLAMHRYIWEEVDKIRESKLIAYKDFGLFREKINNFLKTLSLLKARIRQMKDIIVTKKEILGPVEIQELSELKMNRINNFIGDVNYIEDLWDMTIDYVKDTQNLIESLSQENIQRELSALKFITLIAAITSFFGMNIAFPWEERWVNMFPRYYSFVVIAIIVLTSIAFYFFLKFFVYSRTFKLRSQSNSMASKK